MSGDRLSITVRAVGARDAGPLRELRLRSLAADPDAFGSTYSREILFDAEVWERWAAASESGEQQRTFVLLGPEEQWLGMALVRRIPVDATIDGEGPGPMSPGDVVTAELNAMWVDPLARGLGGLGLLCAAAIAWCAERSVATLELAVVAGNDVALRGYRSAGFAVAHAAQWSEHGRTLDELILQRRITPADAPA